MAGIADYEDMESSLLDQLVHLYDPDYSPSKQVYALAGCDPEAGPIPVQSAILQALDLLKPRPHAPAGARAQQIYEVMFHRYVLKVTQEKTAEALGIGVRSLHRHQKEGVHALARVLWERARSAGQPGGAPARATVGAPAPNEDQTPDWQSQAQDELARLLNREPDALADVGQTISGLLELGDVLGSVHGVWPRLGFVQPGLTARIHPAALRQVLVTALCQLSRFVSGDVTVYGCLEDGCAKITLTGAAAPGAQVSGDEPIRNVLTPINGRIEWQREQDHIFVWIWLPAGDQATVLVVDDNPDMVHFYRRCTVGTRYRIVQARNAESVAETIRAVAPDLVVLDIMLPDVDGWELLMKFHQHPDTDTLPLIVCSVVKEEELALALGAVDFLPKPVQPQRFVQALDRALNRDAAA